MDCRIKALLHERRGDWQAVADGSGVSYSWLSKFVNGHIENPGYGTLRKLEQYLAQYAGPERRNPANDTEHIFNRQRAEDKA